MSRYLSEFLHTCPADWWRVVSEPWRLGVYLRRPRSLNARDAMRATASELGPQAIQERLCSFLANGRFFSEWNSKFVEKRGRQVDLREWSRYLYLAVSFLRPEVVVETGVFDGQSSAVILQALEDNGAGMLVSIDLPASTAQETHAQGQQLPAGCDPGWLIPDYLRTRHELLLGDSRELLPAALEEYGPIGVFLHDSLHTFGHQYFEYTTAWAHICEGGLLIGDDIFWSAAFERFRRQVGKDYILVDGAGAIRK